MGKTLLGGEVSAKKQGDLTGSRRGRIDDVSEIRFYECFIDKEREEQMGNAAEEKEVKNLDEQKKMGKSKSLHVLKSGEIFGNKIVEPCN